MNTNTITNDFELMLNEYLDIAEDNLKKLNKRTIKKAGKQKLRCKKGSYELTLDYKDNN